MINDDEVNAMLTDTARSVAREVYRDLKRSRNGIQHTLDNLGTLSPAELQQLEPEEQAKFVQTVGVGIWNLIMTQRPVRNYLMACGVNPTNEAANVQAIKKFILFAAKQYIAEETEMPKRKRPKAAGKKSE